MTWGPGDWIGWAGSVKAFYAGSNARVTRVILPMDREGEFFMAAIQENNGMIDALNNTLCGIPVMFTRSLPAHRILFESVYNGP